MAHGSWFWQSQVLCTFNLQRPQEAGHASDKERLIGAWHLEHIDSPGPEGKPSDIPQPKGMLIYTRDGHMSVQLMYPTSPTNSIQPVRPEWV